MGSTNKDKNFINFLKRAREIHGDKYDYSKVEYINNRTKICIICPEHGEFWQTPHDHLDKCKCPKCSHTDRILKRRKDLEYFIAQANEVHKNKYDYSKVVYSNAQTPITIICPEHGEFNMRPSNHLNNQGCPECKKKKLGKHFQSNTEDFINKSKKVHGDKYDYSKVDYVNNRVKVNIICPIHGEFIQKPLDHLHGSGCPECGKKFGIAEKSVLESLKEHFKNVEYQYVPQWLHGKTSPQSLDFFLPEYNIGIEYHGRQHFYPNTKFGGEDLFRLIQERDRRKYQRCIENGVKVFYISFERKIPDDYFAPVYRTLDELFHAIDNEIKNQTNNIKLNENDLKYIINQTYKKIIK